MLLDQQSATARLSSPDNLVNLFAASPKPGISIVEKQRCGQKTGIPQHLTREDRNTIKVLADCKVPQAEIAADFKITQPEVSHIKNGKVKTDEIAVESKLAPIRDLAMEKLMKSLNLIDDEKLEGCKAVDLANIATSMSKVVEKTLPREATGPQVNLVVYAPQVRAEHRYEVTEI